MTDERFLELKKSGIYKKQSDMLLKLNDLYHKYLYLHTFNDIELEKTNILKQINQPITKPKPPLHN